MLSPDDRVREFYPSLYLNMGKAHEDIGNREAAKRFYAVDKCGSDVPSEKPNQFTSQSKMHTHPHRTMTIHLVSISHQGWSFWVIYSDGPLMTFILEYLCAILLLLHSPSKRQDNPRAKIKQGTLK
jgi:hypothetical protein